MTFCTGFRYSLRRPWSSLVGVKDLTHPNPTLGLQILLSSAFSAERTLTDVGLLPELPPPILFSFVPFTIKVGGKKRYFAASCD